MIKNLSHGCSLIKNMGCMKTMTIQWSVQNGFGSYIFDITTRSIKTDAKYERFTNVNVSKPLLFYIPISYIYLRFDTKLSMLNLLETRQIIFNNTKNTKQ